MARWEYWLVGLWGLSALWTLLTFTEIHMIAMIALFATGVGFPIALALPYLSSLFVYMTLAAPIYWLSRRYYRPIALPLSLLLSLVPGCLVPIRINQTIDRALAGVTVRDHGGPVRLRPGGTVALLHYDSFRASRCGDACLQLLLDGTAKAVLLGPSSAMTDGRGLVRYWIEDGHGDCPMADRLSRPLGNQPASQTDLITADQCLRSAPAGLREADALWAHVLVPLHSGRNEAFYDLSFATLEYRAARTIYLRSGGRLKEVMYRSYGVAHRLTVPLQLQPPFDFGMAQRGQWRTERSLSSGQVPNLMRIDRLLLNDLSGRESGAHRSILSAGAFHSD